MAIFRPCIRFTKNLLIFSDINITVKTRNYWNFSDYKEYIKKYIDASVNWAAKNIIVV